VVSSGQARRHPSIAGSKWSFRALRKRTVIAGLLMVVVFVGSGTSGYGLTEHGPWRNFGGPVFGCLELVLAALLLWARSVRRRAPESSYMAARLRLFLHRTISSTMVVVLVVVVSSLVWPSLKKYYNDPIVGVPPLGPNQLFNKVNGMSTGEVVFFIVAGLALVVAAIVVTVVLLRRRRAVVAESGERADEAGASLQQAVESGLRALHSTDDARAAIIACYLTMEESLGSAGAARNRAETSAELLDRAVRAGLLHGPAASQLTTLFYEARYSSHALPAGARQDAMRALEAISADLQSRLSASRRTDAAIAGAVT
jgi:hypothetical protein